MIKLLSGEHKWNFCVYFWYDWDSISALYCLQAYIIVALTFRNPVQYIDCIFFGLESKLADWGWRFVVQVLDKQINRTIFMNTEKIKLDFNIFFKF